jgi:hypothetical protein
MPSGSNRRARANCGSVIPAPISISRPSSAVAPPEYIHRVPGSSTTGRSRMNRNRSGANSIAISLFASLA